MICLPISKHSVESLHLPNYRDAFLKVRLEYFDPNPDSVGQEADTDPALSHYMQRSLCSYYWQCEKIAPANLRKPCCSYSVKS